MPAFDINQKLNNSKERRVGIVLAFDSFDEKGKNVLACNSIELSPKMNPLQHVPEVVGYVENALAEFAENNGYERVIMSSHDYNTGFNHSKKRDNKKNDGTDIKKTDIRLQEKILIISKFFILNL